MENNKYPICFKCNQPLTHGSTQARNFDGRWYHIGIDKAYCSSIGCPEGESILDNLRVAQKEGFEIKFNLVGG